jgi:acetyl-CoA carboxylase biotin carboxyl carrier protein
MDLSEIKRLIQLVQKSGIGELEITEGGRTIRIAAAPVNSTSPVPVQYVMPGGQPAMAPTAAGAAAAAAAEAPQKDAEAHLVPVVSPMVGTFYRAPAPDADPYIELGSQVEIGQTVCIVEAMKLMNEIESEVKGRIARILVDNAQPVEYGQTLFLVDPS